MNKVLLDAEPRKKSRKRGKPDTLLTAPAPVMQTRLRRHRLAVVLAYRQSRDVEYALLKVPQQLVRPIELREKHRSNPTVAYEFEELSDALRFARSIGIKLDLCNDISAEAVADFKTRKIMERSKHYAQRRN